MASGNWKDILDFYQSNQSGNLQNICFWMERLIRHLLNNRQLTDVYPLTTHLVLSLTICENYSQVRGKPHLKIQLNSDVSENTKDKHRYDFTVIKFQDSGEIYRLNKDSVFCSFEKSLEVFDEMIAKLREIS
jgi:hypothetical protein